MYSIYVFLNGDTKLFDYKSNILPVIGDIFCKPDGNDSHYRVTKRILNHEPAFADVLTIWVEKTS